MLCPHCKTELRMADRQGIEIDYCPSCRGVWLDRGELDKILERSPGVAPPTGSYVGHESGSRGPWRYGHDDDDDDEHRRRYGPLGPYGDRRYPRRRESWLSDLFDFD